MCCMLDIHIINGRMFNDMDGNLICFGNGGCSAVDIFIKSISFNL